MLGTFSPPPWVSDPDMHYGTCVTHVPWCMPGSLISGFLWSLRRKKRSRHSWRTRNPQFCVSGTRPVATGKLEDIYYNTYCIYIRYAISRTMYGLSLASILETIELFIHGPWPFITFIITICCAFYIYMQVFTMSLRSSSSNFIPNRKKQSAAYISKDTTSVNLIHIEYSVGGHKRSRRLILLATKKVAAIGCPPMQRTRFMDSWTPGSDPHNHPHYIDIIMTTMASQITSLMVVYSIVYSGADQRKHQSSASLAFVRGIHRDRWIPRTKGQ